MEKMAIQLTSEPKLLSAQPAQVFLHTFSGMSSLLECSIMQMVILGPRAVCSCATVLTLMSPPGISSFGACSEEASKWLHMESACISHSQRLSLVGLRKDFCGAKPRV